MHILVTVNLKITTDVIYKAIYFFFFEQILVIDTFLISNTYFLKKVNFNFNGNKIW